MKPSDQLNLYHDFADKLSASKKKIEKDESIRVSYQIQKEFHEEIRFKSDKLLYKSVHRFLYITGLVIFSLHIVFQGLWLGVFGLILMGSYHVVSKVLMLRALKKVGSLNSIDIEGKLLSDPDLRNLKRYNLAIIEVINLRNVLLMTMSVIFTPIIFLSAAEVLFGSVTILLVGLAILLGSFFWMIYFYGNIEELKRLQEKVTRV